AEVAAARTTVAAQQANVQRLTALRSFQQLVAPFDGIITARAVDRGALITAGSGSASAPLFRIARAERLRIYVRVPQTWVRALTPGGQAQILVPEFPARAFFGQVVSTAGALDQASRTLLTEVQIPNDDGSLLPGMFANVQFAIARPEPPLWLPATALILGAGGMQVAVVHDDQTVHLQTVEVGHDLGQKVEIVAGLTGTESVIVNGGDGLRGGVRVRPGEECFISRFQTRAAERGGSRYSERRRAPSSLLWCARPGTTPWWGCCSWSRCALCSGGCARRPGPIAGSCGRGYARAVGVGCLAPPWPINASQGSTSCTPKAPICAWLVIAPRL